MWLTARHSKFQHFCAATTVGATLQHPATVLNHQDGEFMPIWMTRRRPKPLAGLVRLLANFRANIDNKPTHFD